MENVFVFSFLYGKERKNDKALELLREITSTTSHFFMLSYLQNTFIFSIHSIIKLFLLFRCSFHFGTELCPLLNMTVETRTAFYIYIYIYTHTHIYIYIYIYIYVYNLKFLAMERINKCTYYLTY